MPDVVFKALPEAAKKQLEALMINAQSRGYQSDFARRYVAEGKAESVLDILDARDVEVSPTVRDQILRCTDSATLSMWLRRALSARTAEDVVTD